MTKREMEILRQRFGLLRAYGCALSHIRLWERCADSQETLTIAEDDAVFRADFEHEANRVIASLSPDWDMILWGWNFDSILGLEFMKNVSPAFMRFDQDQMRQGIDFFVDSVEKEMPAAYGAWNTLLHFISKGAAALLDKCLPFKRHLIEVP
jgi:GR25 family glycosyltransferase involved in LPS biosynthesis